MSDISHSLSPVRFGPTVSPSGSNHGAGGKTARQEPAGAGTGLPSPAEPVAPEEVSRVVSDLNDYVQSLDRELHFSVDETSGRTVITVVNPETDEVIRQIPPEEVLALAEFLERGEPPQPGLLMRGKA